MMDQDKDVRGEPDRRHTPRPWLGRRAVRGLLVMLVLGVVVGVGVRWGELRGSSRASGTKMATAPQGGPAAGDNRGAAMPGMPGMAPGKAQQGGGPSSDEQMVEVSLTPEAAERAGIKTAVVRSGASMSAITVPGTVMSNAYRDTKVNAHVVSEVTVQAPGDGVVIARAVNPGQVVSSGQELFMVTDLKTVWVIGDLYEKDFATVRVGSPATVMVTSASDRQLRGRVAYIDPRVDPATRTAKVRIEVPNVSGDLRLGMFVNVSFETGGPRMTLVPRSAVLAIGDRSVVYVPAGGEGGRVIARAGKRVAGWGRVMHPLWWMWGAGGIVMILFMLLF